MHCIKKNFYTFSFFFLRNFKCTINSNPIQIDCYRIRIIRSMNLTLCNCIILPTTTCQSHICQKFQITLIWFQSNCITQTYYGASCRCSASLCIIFSNRFHISEQIDFWIIFYSRRGSKLNNSAFSVHRCIIPF